MEQTRTAPRPQAEPRFTIATGKSLHDTKWKNKEYTWPALLNEISRTTRTRETYAEYVKMTRDQQQNIKDVGGFVGGTLKGGRRKSGTVVWRQLLTLDADFVAGDLWGTIESLFDFCCAVYSTHKHSPDAPRLRLIAPLLRPVTPDEYEALARRVAADIGIDMFDDTTYQPARLMFWPSTASDGEFIFHDQDGPWIDPDEVLVRYADWRDVSLWPESSRAVKQRQRHAERQGDPLTKSGIVGAFCRTYDVPAAIEKFLSDTYSPCDTPGRYTYIPGSTAAGLVIYDDGRFAYSNHGTDPATGQLCNAFDLVRIHKFGHLDDGADPSAATSKRPSYSAMCELASADEEVAVSLGHDRLEEARAQFGETQEPEEDDGWTKKLARNKSGGYQTTIDNAVVVMQGDPRLKGRIRFNEFLQRPVLFGGLPWRSTDDPQGDPWRDVDDAGIRHYFETVWKLYMPDKIKDAFRLVSERDRFHPIRQYLDAQAWDGVPRLDTLLIDYLGAEDSRYTRAVTRKTMVGAVARIMKPGCKFDYALALVGPQGVGKSFLVSRISLGWCSDSLTDVTGEKAYEQVQGVWFVELAELAALRRAEVEAVKNFISKPFDEYRAAYAHHKEKRPRQCIFIATTNKTEFLRDDTGNRRFWPVDVARRGPVKSLWKDLTDDEISQIWAEAVRDYKAGEPLFLSRELEADAQAQQEQHMADTPLSGIVQEFLDRKLPGDWDEKDLFARRAWLDDPLGAVGSVTRERVCVLEIFAELLSGDPSRMTTQQQNELHSIMTKMPGWKRADKKQRCGRYGVQRAYVREG